MSKIEYFGSMDAGGKQAPFVRSKTGVARQVGNFTRPAPKVSRKVAPKVAPKKVVGKNYFIRNVKK